MDLRMSLMPFAAIALAGSVSAEVLSVTDSAASGLNGSTIVELKYNAQSISGKRGFDSGEYWEDGAAPGPGKSYRVSNGFLLVCGYGNDPFKGDSLILGNADNGTEGSLRHQYEVLLEIPNLVLVDGDYRVWSDKGQSQRSVRGAATVLSPESKRFRLCPCHDAGLSTYIVNWEMTLTGAQGVGLSVSDKCGTSLNSASTLNIMSSNPNYLGSFEVTGSNLTMGVAAPDSLGGRLDSFDPDALRLKNRATLASSTDGLALDPAYNRGMWIESTGGRVKVAEGQMFTIGWPIDGDEGGSLAKIGGGVLVLPGSARVDPEIIVEEGFIAAPNGMTGVCDRVVFKEGSGLVCGSEFGVVEIEDLVKPESVVKIPVSVIGYAEAGTVIPFLRVPAGTLSEEDFMIGMGAGDYGAPFMQIANIVDETSGVDTFALVSLPVVVNNDVGQYVYGDNAEHWTDGTAVHEDAAYMVSATAAGEKWFIPVTGANVGAEYAFPGHSLTFIGEDAENKTAVLYVGPLKNFTGDVRFYGRSQMCVGNWDRVNTTHFIDGKLYVDTSISDPLTLKMEPSATNLHIMSEIKGDGRMYFIYEPFGNEPDKKRVVTLASANIQYKGRIQLYSSKYPVMTFRISDERNLGGNPSSYDSESFTLQGCEFHPIGTVTIDDENRCVRFAGAVDVRVDEGERLILRSPMTAYNSPTVKKLGDGVIQLGSTSADVFTLSVTEGYLTIENPSATEKVSVAFNGGGIVADMVADGADVRSQYGSVMTNDSLSVAADVDIPVLVNYGDDLSDVNAPIPVATVSASRADEVFGKVRFVRNTERGQWTPVRELVVLDGLECVRLSVRYEKGFTVIVR